MWIICLLPDLPIDARLAVSAHLEQIPVGQYNETVRLKKGGILRLASEQSLNALCLTQAKSKPKPQMAHL